MAPLTRPPCMRPQTRGVLSMRSIPLSVVAMVLASCWVMPAMAQAEDQPSYVPPGSAYAPVSPAQVQPASPAAYPAYQPPPNPVPSGNIIGYRPITNEALEAAMSGATPAPLSARPAYPAAMPSPAGAGTGGGQLPVGYLTGVVGEGFYTLGRDDIIQIDVRNQPEFSGVFVIGFDGKIQYNYLGDLTVAGLTKYEVQQVVEKLLQRFVRVPLVNVAVVAYNSKVVYVIGEVNAPGK